MRGTATALFVTIALAACAAPPAAVSSSPAPAPAAARHTQRRPQAFDARYVLTWAAQRIGDASEALRRDSGGGWTFERTERIALRRGSSHLRMETVVRVALSAELRPERVEVVRRAGASEQRGVAERTAHGRWRASFGAEPARELEADAVPIEVVPLLLGAERRFAGTVMLPGYGFATGEMYTRPGDGASHVVASLVMPAGVLAQELWVDERGQLERVAAPGGVGAMRVTAEVADEAFEPPEIVNAASIPVRGQPPAGRDLVRLIVAGVDAAVPPPLPAQLVRADDGKWDITLTAGFNTVAVDEELAPDGAAPADPQMAAMAEAIARESRARSPLEELRVLARYTDRLIEDDLSAAAFDARTAFALGRGDCTAHATLFAAFARARGYAVRLVTGYRLDGDSGRWRLVRHRWAIARIDDQWVPIDPTHGEAPASATLLGLAVHGASAGEIAVIDEVAFAGFSTAAARFR